MLKQPSWLNEDFLLSVLKVEEVDNLIVSEAVSAEDHYFSTLLRVTFNYKRYQSDEKNVGNIILKLLPVGQMLDFMTDLGIMNRELYLYQNILPIIQNIMGRAVAPLHYPCEVADTLVLEDLVGSGFRMEDRIKRLDFEYCRKAVEYLAEFHAASIRAQEEYPNVFVPLNKELLYTESNSVMKSFIVDCFRIVGDAMEGWTEVSHLAGAIRNFGEKMWTMVLGALEMPECMIKVLNHGDCWTNNLLFKRDASGLLEARFVDFQFSRWSTPAMDLQEFLHTSVKSRSFISPLLRIYREKFNAVATSFSLSEDELDAALRRTYCYGLIVTVCQLPTCLLPSSNDDNPNENVTKHEENSNHFVRACKEPIFKEIATEVFQLYEKRGLL